MSRLLALAAIPLLFTPARGQDHPRAWRFGFSAQVDVPLGDLKTDTRDRVGGGLSALATWRLSPHQVLRPRLDVDVLRLRHEELPGDIHQEVTFAAFGGGVDYLYYPAGNPARGFFLSAGAGLHAWQLNSTLTRHAGSNTWSEQKITRNRTALSVAAGMGWQFNRVCAFELRARTSPYDRPSSGTLVDAGLGDTGGGSRQGLLLQATASFTW